jgi:hypothetical protein
MSGVRQWGRLCSLVAASATGEDGLDLSELRISFRVESRTTLIEPDTLYARIYNLAPQTIQKLLTLPIVPAGFTITSGAPVTQSQSAGSATGVFTKTPVQTSNTPPGIVRLQAGYAGNFGTIFQGQLVQVRVGRESPTDDFVEINAADGDSAHKWGMMNRTYAAGWTAQDIVTGAVQSCEQFGLTGGKFPGQTDPAQRPAPRGKVCFGMVREILEDIGTPHRVNFWINRNNLEAVPLSAYKPGDVVKLTRDTGMIGYPKQTNYGVSVQCLLNPALSRGGRIQIDNKSVQRAPFTATADATSTQINAALAGNLSADGLYKALMVNHVGDTRGNEWYSIIEAIAIDPTGQAIGPGQIFVPDKSLISL